MLLGYVIISKTTGKYANYIGIKALSNKEIQNDTFKKYPPEWYSCVEYCIGEC